MVGFVVAGLEQAQLQLTAGDLAKDRVGQHDDAALGVADQVALEATRAQEPAPLPTPNGKMTGGQFRALVALGEDDPNRQTIDLAKLLLATPKVSGLFNVGTGTARSFRDMMLAAYAALGASPNIQYIDMPEQIRGSYQYFTQSEMGRLRKAGYNAGFTPLEDAVKDYVTSHLDRPDRYR